MTKKLGQKLASLARLRAQQRQQEAAPPVGAAIAGRVARKIESARRGNTNPDVQEIVRICDLPVKPRTLSPEELERISRENILAPAYAKGFRFLDPQAHAIVEYDEINGLFGPVGVGWGKTGIALMIAERAFRKGFETTILLVPPSVVSQLVSHDIGWWRERVLLSTPFHVIAGKTKEQRLRMARSKRKGCYILPYSMLSTADSVELIQEIAPKLIICDEAHNLKNFSAARTRRLMNYISASAPEVVVLSGTITDKGVEDYHHLISCALGDNSPLPISHMQAMQWGTVLNSGALPSETQAGPLMPLIEWARKNYPNEDLPPIVSGFRRAYRLRLTSAPGVVATGDQEIGVSLTISNLKIEKPETWSGYDELVGFMSLIIDEYVTPNGDEIQYPIHTHKWLSELSCGFYNELSWPEAGVLAARKNITLEAAHEQLKGAMRHHGAQQKYNKELRDFLIYKNPPPGIDTPRAVGLAIHNDNIAGLPEKLVNLWYKVKELDFEGRPERDSRAVRVCSYKIDAAVHWAQQLPQGEGAIIWYYHNEVGVWLVERAREAGLDVIHCPAGENDDIRDPKNSGKILVASVMAHGEGKNLQFMQHQFVVQWPRSARVAQQMLGRCHRTGQQADELIVWRSDSSTFDVLNFAACLNDAVYQQQTTGVRQKMVFCGYDPLPMVFSPEFLSEQGLRPHDLTPEQKQMLIDKFGDFQERSLRSSD